MTHWRSMWTMKGWCALQLSNTRSQWIPCNPGPQTSQRSWNKQPWSVQGSALVRMMHLTNYSVNKQFVAYNQISSDAESFGVLCHFKSLRQRNPAFVQNLDGQGEEDCMTLRDCLIREVFGVLLLNVACQDKEDAAVDEKGQPKASKWYRSQAIKMFQCFTVNDQRPVLGCESCQSQFSHLHELRPRSLNELR